MKGKRLWHTIRMYLISSGGKRATYLRDHHVFQSMGKNCTFMGRQIPLYPELISIGNNVHIASNVGFLTHDIINKMLNNQGEESADLREHKGSITIGNNVFVGAGSRILSDVFIGDNVIIGAMTLVNKDIPDNSVVGGVPAKVIGSFEEFKRKRIKIDGQC